MSIKAFNIISTINIFIILLIPREAIAACGDPSSINSNIPVSESECIQRLEENCVWVQTNSSPNSFSCQECQTTPPPAPPPMQVKTITQCESENINDPVGFALCVSLNNQSLSLVDFCYNANQGRWKEDSASFEDRLSFDEDSNDIPFSAIYYDVKLSSIHYSNPIVLSEVAILSPNIPGGTDNVDLLIYNPEGVSIVDERIIKTTTSSSEILLIENFNKLGFGFSTKDIDVNTEFSIIDAATPNLAFNYSYTATGIDSSLVNSFSQGSLDTSTVNYLLSDENFLSRTEIRNKSKGYTTVDQPGIPRFFGLPKEILLEERRNYKSSLGLNLAATENQVKEKVLSLKTDLRAMKTATSPPSINSIKNTITTSTGIILKLDIDANGLVSNRNFNQLSIPKSETTIVDGESVQVPVSNSRSLNKSLSKYLESYKNGNIRNESEFISRDNIQNHLNNFSSAIGSTMDSILGNQCSNNAQCEQHEYCRNNVCACRHLECDGKLGDVRIDKFAWEINTEGNLILDKEPVAREEIGSIFTDHLRDFFGDQEGGSTPQQDESTNNNSSSDSVSESESESESGSGSDSGSVSNTESSNPSNESESTEQPQSEQNTSSQVVTQINSPCSGDGCEHNLNLGSVCNATGPNNTGVIHQYNNKMLTVTSYPIEVLQPGYAECVISFDREPEIQSVSFTCNSDGSIIWGDVSRCASFAQRTFSCEEFGSNASVTQTNLTVFESLQNNSTITREYQNDPSYFDKLSNQYKLLADICISGQTSNISTSCIDNPNSDICYGEFKHSSVSFPDQMFPTYLGNKKGILPGYQGRKKGIFSDTNITWNYFLINPRYTGTNSPSAILARRYDPIFNFANYDTTSVDANPFNPTLSTTCQGSVSSSTPCRSQLDYDELAAFRATNAIKEFNLLAPSLINGNYNRSNLHYYYDFLPTTFYGKGALPRIVADYDKTAGMSKVIRTSYLNLYFSKSCEGGCENLVITSYEKCNDIQQGQTIQTNTEYVCLPRYLDISLQLLDDSKDLFDIKGYDDVRIYDLVFRIHTDKKYSETYNYYLDNLANWTEEKAKHALDYLYPQALKYYDLANLSNDVNYTDTSINIPTNNSPWSERSRELYHSFLAHGGFHSLYKAKVTNTLTVPSNFSSSGNPSRSQWLSWFRQFSSPYTNQITSRIGNGETDNFKFTYDYLLQNYSLAWNPREQLRNIKRVFSIHDSESFHMYDTFIKASANGVIVKAGANNNIIHGVNIEGNSFSDFESYGFVFNENHRQKKGFLVLSDNPITDNTISNNIKSNTYLMGHGIGSGTLKEQVRPDRISTDLTVSQFRSYFPLAFNLCETIDGSQIIGTNGCDKDNNYDDDGLYSPNQIFNPFFYNNQGPEMRASGPLNLYDNSVYFRNFHLKTNENWYLHAKDQESIPITINEPVVGDNGVNYTQASFNLPACNPVSELGGASLNYSDAYCFRGGPDSSYRSNPDYGHYNSINAETDSLIISNSTLQNETSNAINFTNTDNADFSNNNHFTAFGGNYEFVSTTTIDALLFNNIFMNHSADILDLNFRDTGLRTDKNKNRIQVVERNIIAYGTQSKVTGLGTAEQIMKYSNNLVLKVPLGGYHGMFKSFYLHNAQATHGEVLDDSMDTPLMFDFHKPYGVRHSIYNSVMYLQENQIIYSSNSRPKQQGFDFNFNENTYLGTVHDIWYNSNPGSVFNQAKTPLLKHLYLSPLGCGDCLNTSNGFWDNRFGFLGGSNETLILNLKYNPSTTFDMYNSRIFPYLSQGSLQNHHYILSSNTPQLYGSGAIDLHDVRNENDLEQWGKILPYSESSDFIYKFDGKFLPNPLIGHTPRLYNIATAKDTGEPSQRVEYLWDYCYGNDNDNWQKEYPLVYFENDISGNKSFSYRCITGDTQSDFINDSDIVGIEQLMDDIHTRFIDINHLGRDGASLQNRPSEQEITNFFDITKNTNSLNECTALKTIFESTDKKAPALHIDSTTLKTGLKLSVYRDWNGVYRKASTTRGPFEIVGNSITCSSP